MTNREIAIKLWREIGRLDAGFRPEDWPEEIDPIEQALNRANLEGRIEQCEAFLNMPGEYIHRDGANTVSMWIDRLKAELAKERR
jgi:hypothetical protein